MSFCKVVVGSALAALAFLVSGCTARTSPPPRPSAGPFVHPGPGPADGAPEVGPAPASVPEALAAPSVPIVSSMSPSEAAVRAVVDLGVAVDALVQAQKDAR